MILEEEKHIRLGLSFFSEGGIMNVRVEELCCVVFKLESGCVYFLKCGRRRHAPSCSECNAFLKHELPVCEHMSVVAAFRTVDRGF